MLDIIAKHSSEWNPSMNLYELIQSIPDFISTVLTEGKRRKEEEQMNQEERKESERVCP